MIAQTLEVVKLCRVTEAFGKEVACVVRSKSFLSIESEGDSLEQGAAICVDTGLRKARVLMR